MYKGDLSNDMPKRVLVSMEPLTITEQVVSKKLKFIPVKEERVLYDRFLLNKLYLYTTRAGVTLELVGFGKTDSEMEVIYNEIDRVGTNPFRYYSGYKSVKKLVSDLPFRPEVVGVIDIPENRLMYGHWALDF